MAEKWVVKIETESGYIYFVGGKKIKAKKINATTAYLYLVVRLRLSRFIFRHEAVHTAVWTLPVVTSVFEEMRLTQSCTQKTMSITQAEPVFRAKYCHDTYLVLTAEMVLGVLGERMVLLLHLLHPVVFQSASQSTGSHCHPGPYDKTHKGCKCNPKKDQIQQIWNTTACKGYKNTTDSFIIELDLLDWGQRNSKTENNWNNKSSQHFKRNWIMLGAIQFTANQIHTGESTGLANQKWRLL